MDTPPSPDQWGRIKELFETLRELPEAERGKFLDEQCAGDDPAIRAEVERLLQAAQKPQGFLDSPAFQVPLPALRDRSAPQSIARYRIIEKLGEGGMGVVYRGQDDTLKRQLAIKVLLPEQTGDPEWKRRLMREAQAASALNHPNIVTVYDVGTDQGADYIAMEYVAGTTLRERIGHKGLPVSVCLKYAIQIADALATAHAAGIIHRDLKPGNIMVTGKDTIKILDFGLAKPIRLAPRSAHETTTTLGVQIAGTPAYMSPEQAEAKPLDERSDIFSFGSVLYEMLTGQHAFSGESHISILASVLNKEPRPMAEFNKQVPRELERITAMCLRKEPARRLQHMDDVKLALEEMKLEFDSSILAAPAIPRRRSWKWLGYAGAAVLAGVAGAYMWSRLDRNPVPREAPVLTQLTSDSGLSAYPAISRDGRLVAYASDRDAAGNLEIWVQQVGGDTPIRRTYNEADDYDPAFSPDGTMIAFRSEREGGGIYIVGAFGGQARLIARQGRNPQFSPDGRWIAYWVGEFLPGLPPGSARMYVVEADGGQAEQVRADFTVALHPVWAPDGQRLLFFGRVPDKMGWYITPIHGGQALQTNLLKTILDRKLSPPVGLAWHVPIAWLADPDRVLFAAGLGDSTNLWEAPFARKSGESNGPLRKSTSGTGLEMHGAASLHPNRLVYSSLKLNVDLWSVQADPNHGRVSGGLDRLTDNSAFDGFPSISADGSRLAFVSQKNGNWGLWIRDLKSTKETLLVPLRFDLNLLPRISGNGERVIYTQAGQRLYSVGVGSGAVEKLCEGCGSPTHISFDGSKVLLESGTEDDHILLLDTASGKRTDLIPAEPGLLSYAARFSPDQRWISFHVRAADASTRQIFVAPFGGAAPIQKSRWIAVTDGRALDRETCWSPDGNLLYFLSNRDGFQCIWANALDPVSKRPLGAPFGVYHFHHARQSLAGISRSPAAVGLSVAPGRLIFAAGELTGSVWMATRD